MAQQFKFDEDQNLAKRKGRAVPGIAGKLIGWGLAKNESQAQIIMITVVIIDFIVIFYQNRGLFQAAPTQDLIVEPTL